MSKIIVYVNLTLDGVMQAPAGQDEDTREDFRHGGWAAPFGAMSSSEAQGHLPEIHGLLFGRRTYQNFYDFWPKLTDGNPFTEMLNNMQKYVASTSLQEPLPWMNSKLLKGDIPTAVQELRAKPDNNLMIMGSGELIKTLMQHNLVDLYVLLIHPLVLGEGQRLFREGIETTLQLISANATANGVIVATYQPNVETAT